MISSGSFCENNKRLEVLHKQHNKWLQQVAYNLSGNIDVTQDLVQELYLYLANKVNPNLWYSDSFNLKYCHSFLQSRYVNLIKRENKNVYNQYAFKDKKDVPYDEDWDTLIQKTYEDVQSEIKELQRTPMWASAKIYEMYAFGDTTMEKLSEEVGISKSTTFLNIKRIKEHLKENLKNPFDDHKHSKE